MTPKSPTTAAQPVDNPAENLAARSAGGYEAGERSQDPCEARPEGGDDAHDVPDDGPGYDEPTDGDLADGDLADGDLADGDLADGDLADGDDDLAHNALADARSLSRQGGRRRRGTGARRGTRQDAGRNRGGYSAPGPDPVRDPQRLGALIPGYVADLGWQRPLADARVFARWSDLVGPEVAAHCEPQSLRDGELRVTAESTAWATQLRLLAGTLLARLVAELGPDVVRKLVISGPVAPSWKHGPRTLRNGRGPRDTYG